MPYTVLEERIRMLPIEYLNDLTSYIEFLLYKSQHEKPKSQTDGLAQYFGCLKNMPDGLEMQRSMRS